MATLKQVRDAADAKLVTIWQALQTKQAAYFQKHGKYFQLLATGGRDAENQEYIIELVHPSDEQHIADIEVGWSTTIPFELEVHEWVGPYDKGYTAYVTIDYRGTTYQRHRDSNQVDSGWYTLTPII